MSILLVEDDAGLAELVAEYLRLSQYSVHVCSDGQSALSYLNTKSVDLVLLDIMLPGMDGLEVLQKMRYFTTIPVIIISARSADLDKILGLELGADDYLEKPFNHRELLARVKAQLRRSQLTGQSRDELETGKPASDLTIADLYFSLSSRTLYFDNMPVALTGMEYSLLLYLAQKVGQVVSKSELSEECLGRRLTSFDRSIDTHLSKIRKKLGKLNSSVSIKAIRAQGYCLTC